MTETPRDRREDEVIRENGPSASEPVDAGALDAWMVAAFRKEPRSPGVEELRASAAHLSPQDLADIERRDRERRPELTRRILEARDSKRLARDAGPAKRESGKSGGSTPRARAGVGALRSNGIRATANGKSTTVSSARSNSPRTRRTTRNRPFGDRYMKYVVLSSVLSALLVAGAMFFVLDPMQSRVADSGADTERLDSMESLLDTRLTALEERLGNIEDERDATRRASRRSRRPDGKRASSNLTSVGTSEKAADGGDDVDDQEALEEEALAVARRIEQIDGEDGLRNYIAQVYRETRQQRKDDERREAQERQREIEEMHQGPYGEHNYRVNSMAKRLDLNDAQANRYHALIIDYSERIQQQRKMEAEDPDQREVYRENRRLLRQEFADTFAADLNDEQAELFAALGDHERRPDGGTFATSWSFQAGDGATGAFEAIPRLMRAVKAGAGEGSIEVITDLEIQGGSVAERVHEELIERLQSAERDGAVQIELNEAESVDPGQSN